MNRFIWILAGGLFVTAIAALLAGSAGLSLSDLSHALGVSALSESADSLADASARHEAAAAIFWHIRLPRMILATLVGATLAVCGGAMQGLFRNPLVDPGLIGVSAGAALAAVLWIVVGGARVAEPTLLGESMIVLAAFVGGTGATFFIYRLARREGRVEIAVMLLAGIAVNAMAGAGIAVMTFLADDLQLRALTFWMMGSLGRAGWPAIAVAAPVMLLCLVLVPRTAAALNAMLLGEREARHLGVSTESLKRRIILLSGLGVGAAVAVSGIIGFVGLIVPHLMRLIVGHDHRVLLPASALAGAILLMVADIICRTAFAPIELPVGVLTALLGAPFFLLLLLRERQRSGLL